jgi:hypothetical protein
LGGNNLDQNIATVLTTLITVGGTLGGVILGVILSNRYVARQAKATKNSVIIEEVYILLTDIDSKITQNIEFNNPVLQGKDVIDCLRRVHSLALFFILVCSLRRRLQTTSMNRLHTCNYKT